MKKGRSGDLSAGAAGCYIGFMRHLLLALFLLPLAACCPLDDDDEDCHGGNAEGIRLVFHNHGEQATITILEGAIPVAQLILPVDQTLSIVLRPGGHYGIKIENSLTTIQAKGKEIGFAVTKRGGNATVEVLYVADADI